MSKPIMQPVSSSMIRAVGYDDETSSMYVEFSNGTTYAYENVPEADYAALTAGGSAGKYFHDNIKDSFDSRRV